MHPSPRGGRTWKLPGFPARSSGGSDDTWYGATTGCSVVTDSNWNACDLPTEKGCLSARMKKRTWLSTVGCLEVQHYDVARITHHHIMLRLIGKLLQMVTVTVSQICRIHGSRLPASSSREAPLHSNMSCKSPSKEGNVQIRKVCIN